MDLVLSSAPIVIPPAKFFISHGQRSNAPAARQWSISTAGYSYPYNTPTSEPMKTTYAVTMIWNIRPIDPQENSEETTVLLIVAESEEEAIEQALASCAQEDEPDDAFAIQYDEVSYKRYGKQRNGEYGECGLVAAY